MFQPGEYSATVLDQRLTKNKKDNFQMEFRCQLEGHEEDRTIYLVLTEKTYEFTAELIVDVFKVVPEKWSDLDASHGDPVCDVRGRTVTLYCKHEQYEGETKERWSFSNPEMGRKPLEESDRMSLEAMFGSGLTKARGRLKNSGGTAVKEPPAKKGNDEGDAIPF